MMKLNTPRLSSGGTAALLLCSVAAACQRTPDNKTLPTVENVAEQPANFVGKRVTLSGEVDDVYGTRAFELEDDTKLIFDDDVLVLSKSPIGFGGGALEDDDDVVVSGTIRRFDVTELERDLGWDFDPEIEVERWKTGPVLVADSITKVAQYARWSEKDEPLGINVGYVAVYREPDPMALVGREIAFESIPVQSVAGSGLWVGAESLPLFVAPPGGTPEFEPGQLVDLRGTIQRMPEAAAAKEKWGLTPEAADKAASRGYYLEAKRITKANSDGAQAKKTAGTEGAITFAAMAQQPEQAVGKTVSGEAEVLRVISDRAFYISEKKGTAAPGQVLAIVREDVPQHEMIDIDAGQRIRFTGQVKSSKDQVAGKLEQDSKEAIAERPAFITMHWRDVDILEK